MSVVVSARPAAVSRVRRRRRITGRRPAGALALERPAAGSSPSSRRPPSAFAAKIASSSLRWIGVRHSRWRSVRPGRLTRLPASAAVRKRRRTAISAGRRAGHGLGIREVVRRRRRGARRSVRSIGRDRRRVASGSSRSSSQWAWVCDPIVTQPLAERRPAAPSTSSEAHPTGSPPVVDELGGDVERGGQPVTIERRHDDVGEVGGAVVEGEHDVSAIGARSCTSPLGGRRNAAHPSTRPALSSANGIVERDDAWCSARCSS